MLEIGSVIDGKYKILNKVGQGGMSVVYLAMNEKANKQWAVKEVRKDGIKDNEIYRQGLIAEREILTKLKHPYLPSIVDVIDTDDTCIIIMDYVEGNDLQKALDENGALPQEDVIRWAKQLCDVLGYLHSQQPPIIYRDMKPKNVMLKPDGNITLIDFGTARKYREGDPEDTICLGTVGYAAQEQFGGKGQTDARTDIYGLGATLYYLLTGVPPYTVKIQDKPIRDINSALSGGLEQIIDKCTQPDPNDRYQSAAELMYALEHYEEIDDRYRKKQKRKLGWFVVSALLTVAFGVASLWGYLQSESLRRQNYDYILANASSVDDYYEAILTDPTRTEAYLGSESHTGLIKFLIEDESLSQEESSVLSRLRVGLEETNSKGYSSTEDVLAELKSSDPEGYGQVCYEIGEDYLYYYDIAVEKDKYAEAATWMQYAVENHPDAAIYCSISACMENIAKYTRSEQLMKLSEEYETLWTQIEELFQTADDFDDDLRLRVWNEIVSMIQNNTSELCEVESKEVVLDMLSTIQDKSAEVTSTFLQNSIASLKSNIAEVQAKVESVQTDEEVEADEA